MRPSRIGLAAAALTALGMGHALAQVPAQQVISALKGTEYLALTPATGAYLQYITTQNFLNSGPSLINLCTTTGASPVTCNGSAGVLTTGVLTTAAYTLGAAYNVTNSSVTSGSVLNCQVNGYTATWSTNGIPTVAGCTAGTGQMTVWIQNTGTASALAGVVTVGFKVSN